jgi:hypothetical protein
MSWQYSGWSLSRLCDCRRSVRVVKEQIEETANRSRESTCVSVHSIVMSIVAISSRVGVLVGDPGGGEVGGPVGGPVGGEVGGPVDGLEGGEVGTPRG